MILQVRLLGYCVEEPLFWVYEFSENGNLSQHLHGLAGNEAKQSKYTFTYSTFKRHRITNGVLKQVIT